MRKVINISFLFSLICLFLVYCGIKKDPVSFDIEEGNWEIVSNIGDGYITLFFVDSQNGWVVGNNGQIKHTTNGGNTWENQTSGTENGLWSVLFVDDKKGFAAGLNKTLIYTNNGGSDWYSYTIQSEATVFQSLHLVGGTDVWFISNNGELFCSENLGQDWECRYDFNDWGYSYLSFHDNYRGYAMKSLGNKLERTIDGGNNWFTFQLPMEWPGDVFFLNETFGWTSESWGLSSIMHDSAAIYMTNNGGQSWHKQTTIPGLILNNIIFLNNRYGWMSDVTKIYYTTDSGKTFDVQYEVADNGYVADIFFCNDSNDGICGWILTSKGGIIKYSN